jgi:AraC family transcriptional regulator, transcriptional activator of pobA
MSNNFRTLQDFFASINLPMHQQFEMTVHALKGLHGDGKKSAPPFRTDYFSFLLITAGKSSYTIDGQEFQLGSGSFYFTLPGHLKSFDIVEPLEGFLLTFTEAFIKQNLQNNLFDTFPFLINETIPVMQLQHDSLQEIQILFQFIKKG